MNEDEHVAGPVLLERKRKVSLASVLLRTLERLCARDRDQVFVELYDEFKPLAERELRRKERGKR